MKPAAFEYRAPRSIDEALDLLRDLGGDAKLLAGGQSLVPAMNFRVVQPAALIDLNPVTDLQYIRVDGDELRIGAMTRERHLEFDANLARLSPLLSEAVPHIAHPQIRNRGTLGGSLAHADPAAELPVIMLALGARFKVRNADRHRWIEASDFYSGMFSTTMAPDEMLVELELPPMPPRAGWSFLEVSPRAGDFALMGIAVLISLDPSGHISDSRLVYLNAGDGPVVARRSAALLQDQEPGEALFEAAAELASTTEVEPFGNVHATPEYQRHLARVLTRRALRQAIARAQGASRL
jgi:carbon-monoxide dehydrogenase medium subunit